MKDKLLKIVQHYGIEHQQRKLQEEVFELQEAITICESANEWTPSMVERWKNNITEEIADVMVLIHQIRFYYDLDDVEVSRIFTNKIDRQLERIENERNNI